MRVKCRGYEGDLTYLTVNDSFRNVNREPVKLYFIRLSVDKNTNVELARVKESEIEVTTNIPIRLDASAVAMAINRPHIRSETDGKPGVNRGCCCAD